MIVDGKAVFASAVERQLNLPYYADIMQTFPCVDVSADADFQRKYVFFYRVRRDYTFRSMYFEKMESLKGSSPSFGEILNYLYENCERVEPSFASKMLATLNPDMPIWDSIVLGHLGYDLTGTSKVEKLSNAVGVYDRICEWYQGYLASDNARENIALFDDMLPAYRWLSDTKKIDFLLWGKRD